MGGRSCDGLRMKSKGLRMMMVGGTVLRQQLFRVEGKCVLRQVGNGLAAKKPIGSCQSVARETRNPLLTSPSSLLRLLPSIIVKRRCARERGATFSSWACRWYGPEVFVPYSFPRGNEYSGRKKAAGDIRSLFVSAGERIVRAKKAARDIRSLFISAGERIVRAKKGGQCSKE